MSLVTEAQELFFDKTSNEYPFHGFVWITPRRFGKKAGLNKAFSDAVADIHRDWWDQKINSDSLYASSELERFKQDKFPGFKKRMGL